MAEVSLAFLSEQLALADLLHAGRENMLEPQDLPGKYGRAIKAVDRLLQVMKCEAVVAGGWAVWRHGYVGRITQDIDIVLPHDRIDEFLKVASVSGFEVLPTLPGRWPKLRYKDADVQVDILPEGAIPGTVGRPAPIPIAHPHTLGAATGSLRYVDLPHLIELKLGAGRARDDSDIVELIRSNPDQANVIRAHLQSVHADYARRFDELWERAQAQGDS